MPNSTFDVNGSRGFPVHIADTHSEHNIMIDNAPVVTQAIRMVVDALRAGQTSLKG